jgi:hypothetical protein
MIRTSSFHLRRPSGWRGGLVIGLALALVGASVGTATGAVTVTPFQQVVVVNPAASPIPVTGTINVGNTPANQPVTVTNFPSTQKVSGTVDIGNLPSGPVATKRFSKFIQMAPGFVDEVTVDFGQTINITTLIVAQGDDDNYTLDLGEFEVATNHEGNFFENFTAAVPASGALIRCENLVLDCHVRLTVLGF